MIGMDSSADPGGGAPEAPPTPTSPVCDSAYSEHSHGCWPCEHNRESDCETSHPSQPSSGRCSPRWDEDEEDAHHVLSQGVRRPVMCRPYTPLSVCPTARIWLSDPTC
ncbi:hypothetical protein EVAR_56510_1 [Eumeta japonica]|uniref:Uncharacterized protein n=1 Tax=Eumeta variegata TaxID=151549 RepID=A0A4C1Z9X4_EUMVA|nr:hypothetical protein EVAR_56510_1 [Eumeta japonica]